MARHVSAYKMKRTVSFLSTPLRSLAGVVVLASTICLATSASGAPASTWTVYHADPLGTGLTTAVRSVDTSHAKWTSRSLDGELYGEPLVFGNDVYVATENDTVYALSARDGTVVWSRHVATAVNASSLPCGNITPRVGITGTPVIDTSRHELFVVAEESLNTRPAHVVFGLDTTTGALLMKRRVDPSGSNPDALLQRTGLTLDQGHVVLAMGGLYGDCGNYRGTVVSLSEVGGVPSFFSVDQAPGESQGAIWMGGAAPVVDAHGDIWVSVGNGSSQSSTDPYDYSDSVLDLSSSLHLRQFFAPSSWPQDNASDLDMSMAPALLRDGQVVVAGKARIVYLLNTRHLGGIGHQRTSLANACNDDIDGASAVLGTTVFLPCLSGPVAVSVGRAPSTLRILWSAGSGGGPPIVAANLVWSIGPDGELYGLNPKNGAVRQRAFIGRGANHFPTPSVGDGLLLATNATHVIAFAGRSG